jgi:hypothetical protein
MRIFAFAFYRTAINAAILAHWSERSCRMAGVRTVPFFASSREEKNFDGG